MDVAEILQAIPDIITANEIETPEGFKDKARVCEIRYRSGDCEVMGYYACPRDWGDEPLPGLVFNRGGNRSFGHLRPEAVCRYASHGFHVFGSQYRGVLGGTGMEEYGGEEVADVLRLIDISQEHPGVIRGGVYMVGHSRGGMMTYLCCKEDNRIVAAAVAAGLADCVDMFHRREQAMKDVFLDLVGGTPEELPEEYERRSAVCWADKIKVPLFIGHGTNDWRVHISQALRLAEALERSGKEYRLKLYEGGDHSLRDTSFVEDALQWFAEHPIDGVKGGS
jgi:dipeptidyl aminopeptidase/acylaminoacyl peptidase